MIRLTAAFLLLLSIAPVSAHAAAPLDLAVNQALSDALARDGVAPIEVTLDLTATLAAGRDHAAAGSGVHPAVFDIAMMAAAGPLQLDRAGEFHLLRLTATDVVVGKILAMNEVVAVHLDAGAVERGPVLTKGSPCPGTSTRACLSNNFSVAATYGGVTGKVAAIGGDSATFWAYSSNNWEVLAKVLNGCGINGHWWLLGAAAGTSSYSIASVIWVQGGSIHLGSWSASNKPIVNLQLFSCT